MRNHCTVNTVVCSVDFSTKITAIEQNQHQPYFFAFTSSTSNLDSNDVRDVVIVTTQYTQHKRNESQCIHTYCWLVVVVEVCSRQPPLLLSSFHLHSEEGG